MAAEFKLDFQAILRTLAEHGVDYIVVGGVCAALHGAPVSTFDLEMLIRTKKETAGGKDVGVLAIPRRLRREKAEP